MDNANNSEAISGITTRPPWKLKPRSSGYSQCNGEPDQPKGRQRQTESAAPARFRRHGEGLTGRHLPLPHPTCEHDDQCDGDAQRRQDQAEARFELRGWHIQSANIEESNLAQAQTLARQKAPLVVRRSTRRRSATTAEYCGRFRCKPAPAWRINQFFDSRATPITKPSNVAKTIPSAETSNVFSNATQNTRP